MGLRRLVVSAQAEPQHRRADVSAAQTELLVALVPPARIQEGLHVRRLPLPGQGVDVVQFRFGSVASDVAHGSGSASLRSNDGDRVIAGEGSLADAIGAGLV